MRGSAGRWARMKHQDEQPACHADDHGAAQADGSGDVPLPALPA